MALRALALALLCVGAAGGGSPAERGLTAAAVLAGAASSPPDASPRRFAGPVLAYVTPWNAGGFDAALMYATKLTHVSPAWYALRPAGSGLRLDGREGAAERADWSARLRASGPRLVPRVTLELDAASLGTALADPRPLAALLAAECATLGFDGVALDGWAGWPAAGVPRPRAVALFRAVAAALHASSRLLVLAAPPPVPAGRQRVQPAFDRLDFDAMTAESDAAGDAVDLISLMTYDAALAGSGPGPNAPLAWAAASLTALLARRDANAVFALQDELDAEADADVSARAARVLLGLNFYGYDFALGAGKAPQAVRGDDVAALLRAHPEAAFAWDGDAKEHKLLGRRVGRRVRQANQARRRRGAAQLHACERLPTRGADARRSSRASSRRARSLPLLTLSAAPSLWRRGQPGRQRTTALKPREPPPPRTSAVAHVLYDTTAAALPLRRRPGGVWLARRHQALCGRFAAGPHANERVTAAGAEARPCASGSCLRMRARPLQRFGGAPSLRSRGPRARQPKANDTTLWSRAHRRRQAVQNNGLFAATRLHQALLHQLGADHRAGGVLCELTAQHLLRVLHHLGHTPFSDVLPVRIWLQQYSERQWLPGGLWRGHPSTCSHTSRLSAGTYDHADALLCTRRGPWVHSTAATRRWARDGSGREQ